MLSKIFESTYPCCSSDMTGTYLFILAFMLLCFLFVTFPKQYFSFAFRSCHLDMSVCGLVSFNLLLYSLQVMIEAPSSMFTIVPLEWRFLNILLHL